LVGTPFCRSGWSQIQFSDGGSRQIPKQHSISRPTTSRMSKQQNAKDHQCSRFHQLPPSPKLSILLCKQVASVIYSVTAAGSHDPTTERDEKLMERSAVRTFGALTKQKLCI
jgi:hypothetical protein